MARTDNLTNFLTDVAEAIRAKGGTSEKLSASEFDTAITNLPSGGGGSYEAIGAKVTVEARGAIAKGGAWEGVLNDEYVASELNTQSYTNNGSAYYSKDLSVGITNTQISTSLTNVTIYFWNAETSTYDDVIVDISGVAPNLGHTVSSYRFSDDGTLCCVLGSGNSFLFLEIDKENRTATPYVVIASEKYTSVNSGWKTPCFFGDKYIVINSGAYTEADGTKLGVGQNFFEYSTETHSLKFINRVQGTDRYVYTSKYTPEVSPNTWMHVGSHYATSNSPSAIFKFALSGSEFTLATTPISGESMNNVSSDGRYITATSGSTQKLYGLNVQDLSLELITSKGFSNSNYTWWVEGTKLIQRYSSGSTNTCIIYDISAGDVASWIELAKGSFLTPTVTRYGWNWNKWIGEGKTTIFGFPQGSEAQYLISPATNPSMEAGKVYGIASNPMNLGDVGTAQLLFST